LGIDISHKNEDISNQMERSLPVEACPGVLQTNWTSSRTHFTPVLEKLDHTRPVMALVLAPAKELKGTVMVCFDPVRPLTAKKLLE